MKKSENSPIKLNNLTPFIFKRNQHQLTFYQQDNLFTYDFVYMGENLAAIFLFGFQNPTIFWF